jgi:Ca2+-binding RTX toxin-like protein
MFLSYGDYVTIDSGTTGDSIYESATYTAVNDAIVALANASFSVYFSGSQIQLASFDTVFLMSSANDDNVYVQSNDVVNIASNITGFINGNDATVQISSGSTANITGTADTVIGANGTIEAAGGSGVNVSGGSDEVDLFGPNISVNLLDSSGYTINGNGGTIAISSATGLSLNGSGNTIVGGAGAVDIVVQASSGADTVNLGTGAATVSVSGGASVVVNAGAGSLAFIGGAGASTVMGGAGNATIFAGAGGGYFAAGTGASDVLVGGGGNDTLTAGSGADTLVGGSSGTDVFDFVNETAGQIYTITSFHTGDELYLASSSVLAYALSHQATSGSLTTITLADNTKIIVQGASSPLTSSSFGNP